jgi:hypothetical protein
MTTQPNDVILYLKTHPELKEKWVNQCCACERLGYKPAMPVELENRYVSMNLQKYLPEMGLDDTGLCEQCAAALERARPTT